MMSVASFEVPYAVFIVLLILWNVSYTIARQDAETSEDQDNNYNNVNKCPIKCACLGNVVDCSGLQLISSPSKLPPWTEIL